MAARPDLFTLRPPTHDVSPDATHEIAGTWAADRVGDLTGDLGCVEDANAAGLSYLRIPLGASDFAASRYSFDDVDGDTCLNDFDINNAPPYLFSVLSDIQAINSMLRVHLVPWSPPAWMKTSGTMNGGSLKPEYAELYAHYLLKALQGFKGKGITAYAISIQNEPGHDNPTYPTARLSVEMEAQVGRILKGLMRANGWSGTKLIGYDHNWDNAGTYPVQLMQQAADVFDGVAFHCYAGSVGQQDLFNRAFPIKNVPAFMARIGGPTLSFIGNVPPLSAIQHNARAALMWNIALDDNGNPKIPGTASCGGPGCRGIVTINNDGTWSVNQECSLSWALRVGAYVTYRAKSTDWLRYSLVVLNWNDSVGGWNPQDVTATIEFRGKRVTFTFPVGITTLWWYAPSIARNPGRHFEEREMEVFVEHNGTITSFVGFQN
ncbi:glycosyl hydrolase family 30 [Coprinopsis cinerea okayama7|uniref:Glycosyl hydrolase family 30 n=1 Tax=Coprinopsis cinerea (strain Okayama-7 / 130 / ATCC MYA-4618 / FGSC 9003) TaxID=240176 RepID=A8NIR7_COPC7|nr:glycosyl hydrolase family 30 [Coprinopsis cinerea okayama7\|eukprot:XP_001834055.2 glycosyl hydrolase family 30 [Coprinopsis cinerea okayama7\